MASDDPEFERKAADIIALYLCVGGCRYANEFNAGH